MKVIEIIKNFEGSGKAVGKMSLIPGKGICTLVGRFLRYYSLLWKRKLKWNVGAANKGGRGGVCKWVQPK